MSICIYQAPPVQLQNLFFDARVHCLVLEPQYLKFGTIPRHWLVTNRPFQNCISHWYATNIIEVAVISIGTDQFGRNYGRRKLLEIESLNKRAVLFLNSSGYDGNEFEKLAPRKKQNNIFVTVPLSRERQYALSNASTAGARFFATNGEHLTSEDYFISAERKRRQTRAKDLEKQRSNG